MNSAPPKIVSNTIRDPPGKVTPLNRKSGHFEIKRNHQKTDEREVLRTLNLEPGGRDEKDTEK